MPVVLSAPRQQIVDDFVAGLKRGGPRGLWLFGPRQSGTSTIALHAARTIDQGTARGEFDELMAYGNGKTVSAIELEGLQRDIWRSESVLRANSHDMGLWDEDTALNDRWNTLMHDTDILFIDQMIMPNVDFWKKYLLLPLDARLRTSQVTIFAGTVGPRTFGPDWAKGLEAFCKVTQLRDWDENGEG